MENRRKISNREVTSDILNELVAGMDGGSIITVVGVGGAGGNAVNYMHKQGITNVEFLVCNTDVQALQQSPVKHKLCLGRSGLGAGNTPSVGREMALESLEEIKSTFERLNTKMVFFTAGMGGGTGTGATPEIAKIAREMGILSVAIVTLPLVSEGQLRTKNAMDGVTRLREYVDSLLIIKNDNISKLYKDVSMRGAFIKTDEILNDAVRGIAEIITVPNTFVNSDFADVKKVLTDSGRAHLGLGVTTDPGTEQTLEKPMLQATKMALESTLLDKNSIVGAKDILLNITVESFDRMEQAELIEVLEYLQQSACTVNNEGEIECANIIWGGSEREAMGRGCEIVLVATNFRDDNLEKDDFDEAIKAAAAGKTTIGATVRSKPTGQIAKGDEVILQERVVRYPNIEAMLEHPAYKKNKVELITEEQMIAMINERNKRGDV